MHEGVAIKAGILQGVQRFSIEEDGGSGWRFGTKGRTLTLRFSQGASWESDFSIGQGACQRGEADFSLVGMALDTGGFVSAESRPGQPAWIQHGGEFSASFGHQLDTGWFAVELAGVFALDGEIRIFFFGDDGIGEGGPVSSI